MEKMKLMQNLIDDMKALTNTLDKVKDLINYYGCHKLSEIDSKYYEEILEKIEKF